MNKNFNLRVPQWWLDKLEEAAKKRMLTKSDLVRIAVNEYFERHKED